MAGGVMVLVAGVYSAQRAMGLWRDVWLVRHGVSVDAMVVEVDGDPTRNKVHLPEQRAVFKLRFIAPDGSTRIIVDRLRAQRRAIAVGETIPLFIDPDNASRWTDRRNISWGEEMAVAAVLAGAGLGMVAVAAVRRRGVLMTWRMGEAMVAVVVETGSSALAPRSRSVRFVMRDGKDKRVYSTLVPTKYGWPAAGESIWMVTLAGGANGAIVAALYA